MKILIVLAHPQYNSFNCEMYRATIETLKNEGHEIKTTNLYRLNFNPAYDIYDAVDSTDIACNHGKTENEFSTEFTKYVAEIKSEKYKVAWCDLMVWQFPLWWFKLPSILKGWCKKVLPKDFTNSDDELSLRAIAENKKSLMSITTGSSLGSYLKKGDGKDVNVVVKSIHKLYLENIGFSFLKPQICFEVDTLSEMEKKRELKMWRDRLKNIFDEKEIEFDENSYSFNYNDSLI